MNHSTIQVNADESIQISWGKNWSNFTIRQNDELIGEIQSKGELALGRKFRIGSGKIITPILRDDKLEIWCNGKELVSGLFSGSVDHFFHAVRTLFVVGVVMSGGGLIVFFITQNWWMLSVLVIGAAYLTLGRWANKSGSTLPFKIGLVLNLVPSALSFLFGAFLGLLVLGATYYYLIKGIGSEKVPSLKVDYSD